ncbi:MAG: putative transcription factor [Methanothermococcus sp.]|nr:putative transcription factor [Methanothermococcus sp.]MDK2987134.1 putative transcription factor [Methanothermococcus sp.]
MVIGGFMLCELCGKEVKNLLHVRIEGAEMQVCEECAKFGIAPKSYSRKPRAVGTKMPQNNKKTVRRRPTRDIFDNLKIIVEDYGTIIKEAREKKGMKLEDLARKIGIKESTLHKIERNELEPEEKYVKRLEKELNINLYEEGEQEYSAGSSEQEFTLGDFVKVKKRK